MKQQQKIIYLGLSGATGRMGKAIQSVVKQKNSGFRITAHLPAIKTTKVNLIDGVIDFSAPPLFMQTLKWCLQHNKAFVSGTTGLNHYQKKILKQTAERIPIFYAENMSEGIWRIQQWIKQWIKSILSHPTTHPLSIKIEDIHHKNKKDKPSGTALKLLNCFPKKMGKQIPIKSYRKGQEFGTHRVYFKTKDEIILLQHQALSRKLFAKGALIAMRYLLSQKKGLYSWDNIYK